MAGMIEVIVKGSFKRTQKFFNDLKRRKYLNALEKAGEQGVEMLREATPKRTGKTANSWSYRVEETGSGYSIVWNNSNVVNGWASVALLIQMGHGTKTGAYVKGIDYINPALEPLFKQLGDEVILEIKRL